MLVLCANPPDFGQGLKRLGTTLTRRKGKVRGGKVRKDKVRSIIGQNSDPK